MYTLTVLPSQTCVWRCHCLVFGRSSLGSASGAPLWYGSEALHPIPKDPLLDPAMILRAPTL